MSAGAQAERRTIETDIPQRLDRLPWSRFHWLVVIGLGTVWILDGLEVTIVGSVASRLTEKGSGIAISTAGIGIAAAFYVGGACLGALFFGQLTDRFGRKKLFLVTLALYIAATVATAFAWTAWYFYAMRFLTGAGIGGEYAAINSAIDELIPARVRGRIDLIINGSYWIGAMAGAAAAIVLLNESLLPKDIGWRLSFALGAILGLSIMLVRRNVPESPRWLFIHGREEEAEQIVRNIEEDAQDSTGEPLDEPEGSIEVRQRERIPLREIAKQAFQVYPKRSVLCLALFVGQAFIYNAVTFDLGTLFTKHFGVSSSFVPVYFILFAAGNFLGPLVLGHLFDAWGRKPMISLTYLGSAAILVVTGILIGGDSLTSWSLIGLVMATFFLASAGASAAYLTASEIFPMEMRALAIAFFYAIGTAAGGITGPLLFGHMIAGSKNDVMVAFLIGAAVMALGGIAEIFLGVNAEQRQLEDIAEPITAREAAASDGRGDDDGRGAPNRHAERSARRSRGAYGPRRYRPGPGTTFYSPGMIGTAYSSRQAGEDVLDREVDRIVAALEQEGRPVDRRELERLIHARVWGPGRFSRALNEAVAEGHVRRVGRSRYQAVGGRDAAGARAPDRTSAGS
jgi:MFS family permease